MKTEAQDRLRVYEIGYVLLSSLPEEKASAEVEALKKELAKHGAEVLEEGKPELKALAYEMRKNIKNEWKKYNEGFIGHVKFSLSADVISEAKKIMDTNENVLRYLLIETVAESTRAPEKFRAKEAELEQEKKDKETAGKEKAASELIDKKIDEIVEANTETAKEA